MRKTFKDPYKPKILGERALVLKKPKGMSGPTEGHHAHALDAMKLVAGAWNRVAPVTIKRYVNKDH